MRHVPLGFAVAVGVALASCGGSGGGGGDRPPDEPLPNLLLSTFQAAAVVVGQPNATSGSPNAGQAGTNAVGLHFAFGAVAGALYVPDSDNHRVLGFSGVPTTDGAAASFVLGQPDLVSNAPGTTASTLRNPTAAVVSQGRLFVTDFANHRVLIWNELPTSNVPADVVVGQPDFTTGTPGLSATKFNGPNGLEVADGRLYVADENNHRVLIWHSIPTTNGAPADQVLGQLDFVSSSEGLSDYQMRYPAAVAVGGGRLFVADTRNHRVLAWNTAPPAFALADYVLGQPGFITNVSAAGASGMFWPTDVHASDTQLFVAEAGNNRVLVYDGLPTTIGEAADKVLGQSTFAHVQGNDDDQDGIADATPSGRTFLEPKGLAGLGNRLFVTDRNHRVLIFVGQ
jgi:hypothetical protein